MRIHRFVQICNQTKKSQAGVSLVETVVALGLLMIAAAGILTFATVAMSTTETQGHLAARTAEYAQDKMEQLLALSYRDIRTDTTRFPSVLAGACPPGCGLLPGGGLNPNAPVAGYSDYVDVNGNPLPPGAVNWAYVRVWQITNPPGTANLIQISVLTQVRHAIGQRSQTGILPTATVTCLKSDPF
ncbi:MAG: hypothetical protein DMG38_19240 [Acidobacteria bacterium]|nr:MAG: hypothetical protein DMG38_19240 [Acidobacteriota bacterium]